MKIRIFLWFKSDVELFLYFVKEGIELNLDGYIDIGEESGMWWYE